MAQIRWPRRRWLWWLAAVPVAAGATLAAAFLAGPSSSGPSLTARDVRWQRDIAFVASSLPRVHVDGLAGASRSGWNAAARRLEAAVPRLSDGRVIVGLLRLVARLHDNETVVGVPFTRFYPFAARWVGGHLRLLTVAAAEHDLLGAELVSVDGHRLAEVLARLRTVVDYQDPGVLRYTEQQLIDYPQLLHRGYRLIVDLRDNGGGDTTPFQALISGILADPAINTRGRIFGLINSATDSSAGLDAADLGRQTQAILMGDQIEDPIDRFGNSSGVLKLPHSRLAISYTTKVVNPSGRPAGRPDVGIRPTLRQVLEGIDPVLARALSYRPPDVARTSSR